MDELLKRNFADCSEEYFEDPQNIRLLKPPAPCAGKTGGAMIVYTARLYETMPGTKVGIREFRATLDNILESKTPVTVTRHGQTLGVFVPIGPRSTVPALLRSRKPTQVDLEDARMAREQMDAMITATGTTAEELIADSEELRRKKRASRSRQ